MATIWSSMARRCAAFRLGVLLAWVIIIVLTLTVAANSNGRFRASLEVPGSESATARERVAGTFPQFAADYAELVISYPGGRLDSKEASEAVAGYLYTLSELDYIAAVVPPLNEQFSGLETADMSKALAYLRVTEDWSDKDAADLRQQVKAIALFLKGAEASVGGGVYADSALTLSAVQAAAAAVAVVILAGLLGSLVAGFTALLVALAAAALTIGAGLLARSVLPVVSPVAFAAAVMVAFGLGLAFALPVLRRHRQQLAEGMPMLESIVASAGRGVAVAAMQAVALAGTGLALCVTGIGQLVAAGLLVVVAVAVAALLAGTALPALLALGEEWYVPDEGAAKARRPRMAGLLAAVGARPRIAVVVSLLLLAALAVPGFGAVQTPLGAGQAAPGTPARDVFTEVARDFGPGYNAPLVVSMSLLGSDDPSGVLDSLRAQVQANPDVSRVVFASPNANIDTGVLFVIPATGPGDPATTALVWQLRTDAAAWLSDFGVSAAVSGQAARDVDVMDRLGTAAPWFALLLALIAAGVLLAATASLRYWLLASAGAALACAAAFGVSRLVWGELDALLAFLGGGLLFGLGIAHGVAVGAGRRSVPDAARLTAVGAVVVGVVFAFFVPAQPPPVQQLALFLSVGVLVDALLLRLILIPALARLLGDRLWRPTRIAGRVPSADLEGDALARRAEALASLPADNGIHVQGLTVRANGRELFAGLDLELSPGTVQVLEGDPAATRALLYGLGGRIAVEGSGMVAGYTINDERRDIRRVTKLLRADSPPPQFRRPATPVVLVDRADALSAEQGAALRWGLKANPKLTWVLGVQDPDFIQTLGIRAVPTRTALDQTGVTV